MRGAIALYRQQHDEYAASSTSTGGTCTGGTGGTGALETQAALRDQLTRYTNVAGQSCSLTVGRSFEFGPYLKGGVIPANPVTGSNVVAIVGAGAASAGDLEMTGDGAGQGWKYDVTSGKFIANDTSLDSSGVRFDSY